MRQGIKMIGGDRGRRLSRRPPLSRSAGMPLPSHGRALDLADGLRGWITQPNLGSRLSAPFREKRDLRLMRRAVPVPWPGFSPIFVTPLSPVGAPMAWTGPR